MFAHTEDEAVRCKISMLIPQDRQRKEEQIVARVASGERVNHIDTVRCFFGKGSLRFKQTERGPQLISFEMFGQAYRTKDNQQSGLGIGLILVRTLVEFGNDVRTAYGGEQAIEVASEFRPVVIFMDIGMPNMDGNEAARCICKEPWGRTYRSLR